MATSFLHRLTKEEIPKAVACLKDAFADDPLWTVIFKNDPDRENALSAFFTFPLLYGMNYGHAWAASPEIEGVAVWVPGKYAEMTVWRMLCSGALPYGAKLGKETLRKLAIVSKQLVPVRKKLTKEKPFLYLAIIGISSAAQGKGLGSKIMDVIKDEADRKKLHLYVETEKEENLLFYQKHGFTLLQKIVFEEINLPMWLMERTPTPNARGTPC
jgi:GNAT superfamily N-acetyltransferase